MKISANFLVGLFLAVLSLTVTACNDESEKPSASAKKADFTLKISDISFEQKNERQQFNHTRSFQDMNGVGLTITRGKICVESRNTCVEAYVDYKVEADKALLQPNHHVATRQGEDIITFEYWAKDNNGFEHHLLKRMKVDGQTAVMLAE